VIPADVRQARLGVTVAFVLHAAVFATWAPRVPAIKHALGLTDGQLGIALFGMTAGVLLGTRVVAWPINRFGSRPVIRVGGVLLCAALVGPALATSLATLAFSLAILGALGGVVDVAINAQAVAVERAYARPIMSSLHGVWSLGGVVVGLVAAGAAQAGVSPKVHFGGVAVVLAVASMPFLGRLLPLSGEPQPHHDRPADNARRRRWPAQVVLLGVIAFAAFVAEGSAADWSAVYLHDNLDTSAGVAASGFVAFSLAMAACRFRADRLAARFGPVAVIRAGSVVAALGLAVGLALQTAASGLIAFALLGAGLAPAVPITISAAGNTPGEQTGTMVARVMSLGYAGGVVGPLMIGIAATSVGLRAALLIPVVLALVIAAVAGRVSRVAD
jgi:MFS family permease